MYVSPVCVRVCVCACVNICVCFLVSRFFVLPVSLISFLECVRALVFLSRPLYVHVLLYQARINGVHADSPSYGSELQVYVRDFVRLGNGTRLHARKCYYGRPRYDVLEIHSGDERAPYYARCLMYFDALVAGTTEWRRLGVVWWLDRIPGPSHVNNATTYSYWGAEPEIIELDTVFRSIRLATSRIRLPEDKPAFILLHYGKGTGANATCPLLDDA